jgi:hypothetical protein
LLPNIAGVIDEFSIVKSMYTEQVNHDPAIKFIQSGFQLAGRPCMGSWVDYGRLRQRQSAAFVVMSSAARPGQNINRDLELRLPAVTPRRGAAAARQDPCSTAIRRASREARRRDATMRSGRAQQSAPQPEILSKIAQYETASHASSVPEATDQSEPDTSAYGPTRKPGSYARSFTARRPAERGEVHPVSQRLGPPCDASGVSPSAYARPIS